MKVGDLVRYKREHTLNPKASPSVNIWEGDHHRGVTEMSQDLMTGIVVNISKSHLAAGYILVHVLWDNGRIWNAYKDRLEVIGG